VCTTRGWINFLKKKKGAISPANRYAMRPKQKEKANTQASERERRNKDKTINHCELLFLYFWSFSSHKKTIKGRGEKRTKQSNDVF
jgi:hypothetical protein